MAWNGMTQLGGMGPVLTGLETGGQNFLTSFLKAREDARKYDQQQQQQQLLQQRALLEQQKAASEEAYQRGELGVSAGRLQEEQTFHRQSLGQKEREMDSKGQDEQKKAAALETYRKGELSNNNPYNRQSADLQKEQKVGLANKEYARIQQLPPDQQQGAVAAFKQKYGVEPFPDKPKAGGMNWDDHAALNDLQTLNREKARFESDPLLSNSPESQDFLRKYPQRRTEILARRTGAVPQVPPQMDPQTAVRLRNAFKGEPDRNKKLDIATQYLHAKHPNADPTDDEIGAALQELSQ